MFCKVYDLLLLKRSDIMKHMGRWVSAGLVGLLATTVQGSITHGGTTVNMDFVYIGHTNVAKDARSTVSRLNAVTYEYLIGKYEVTADQWNTVVHPYSGTPGLLTR